MLCIWCCSSRRSKCDARVLRFPCTVLSLFFYPLTMACLRDGMMKFFMTSGAKSYKVFFAIIAQVTPKLNMVNLQLGPSSTILASPIISFQDLATESSVGIWLQPNPPAFRLRTIHADSFRLLTNSSLSGPGRSSTSRRIETEKIAGLASSRVAPARKSAQIISMQ
jgi:hypothetical protein